MDSYVVLDAAALLHVRFLDYQFELLLAELDLPHRATDEQIKEAVAAALEIPVCKLDYFDVVRHANGDLSLLNNLARSRDWVK